MKVSREADVASGKPVIVCTIGKNLLKYLSKMLENDRIPVHPTSERAVKSINALISYGESLESLALRAKQKSPFKT